VQTVKEKMLNRVKEGGHLYEIVLPEGQGEPLYTLNFRASIVMATEYSRKHKGVRVMTYNKDGSIHNA